MTEVEDEDSWLYGDSTKEESINTPSLKEPDVKIEIDEVENSSEKAEEQVTENGKEPAGEAPPTDNKDASKNGDEEEGDDSDDDVQVTIGEITTGGTPGTFPAQGLRTFYRNPVPVPQKPTMTKGLDMEAPGDINGTPVLETNIDLIDEKPWRKPGADISDYFNFGFNEYTWKQYCDKQKKFRGQLENTPVITLPLPKLIQNGVSFFNSPPYLPVPKFENTVKNISTLQFSRRKEDELLAAGIVSSTTAMTVQSQTPLSVALAYPGAIPRPVTTQVYMPTLRPPVSGTLPSTPLPFPPINPNQPPPALPIGMPPPGFLMPGMPPPGMPPPGVVPRPNYLQSAGLVYPPGIQPPVAHMPPPFYSQQDGDPRYSQFDDRHGRPSDSEADRHSEEDGRYRRERGSSSRRDYDRDRYSKRDHRESRGRERDHDRERDRDREKERERSERDRDRERDKDRDRERDRSQTESSSSRRYKEESPSRRRRKHEDDDKHSSKHKKAKKHKHKDRDSDAPPGTEDGAAEEDQGK